MKKRYLIIIFFALYIPVVTQAVDDDDDVYDKITDKRYLDRYDTYLGIEYNMPYEKSENGLKRRNVQFLYGKKIMFEQTYVEISLGKEKVQNYEVTIGDENFAATNKGFQTKLKIIQFFNNTLLHNYYYTAVSYSVVYEQTNLKDYQGGLFEMKYAEHLAIYFGYEIPFDHQGRKNTINFEATFDILPYVYGFSSSHVSETNRIVFTIGYKHYF